MGLKEQCQTLRQEVAISETRTADRSDAAEGRLMTEVAATAARLETNFKKQLEEVQQEATQNVLSFLVAVFHRRSAAVSQQLLVSDLSIAEQCEFSASPDGVVSLPFNGSSDREHCGLTDDGMQLSEAELSTTDSIAATEAAAASTATAAEAAADATTPASPAAPEPVRSDAGKAPTEAGGTTFKIGDPWDDVDFGDPDEDEGFEVHSIISCDEVAPVSADMDAAPELPNPCARVPEQKQEAPLQAGATTTETTFPLVSEEARGIHETYNRGRRNDAVNTCAYRYQDTQHSCDIDHPRKHHRFDGGKASHTESEITRGIRDTHNQGRRSDAIGAPAYRYKDSQRFCDIDKNRRHGSSDLGKASRTEVRSPYVKPHRQGVDHRDPPFLKNRSRSRDYRHAATRWHWANNAGSMSKSSWGDQRRGTSSSTSAVPAEGQYGRRSGR